MKNPASPLTDAQVREIRRLHIEEGASTRELAKRFGIASSSYIAKLLNNKARFDPGYTPRAAAPALTDEQVREIRRLYVIGGHTTRQLAARYGIASSSYITKIVRNRAYIDPFYTPPGAVRCRGTRNPNAKLHEGLVVLAKQLCNSGMAQATVGDHLGVSQSEVSLMVRGKRWPSVHSDARASVGVRPIIELLHLDPKKVNQRRGGQLTDVDGALARGAGDPGARDRGVSDVVQKPDQLLAGLQEGLTVVEDGVTTVERGDHPVTFG